MNQTKNYIPVYCQNYYYWTFSQDDETVKVKIDKDPDEKKIIPYSFNFSEDDQIIKLSIQGSIPAIYGRLWGKAKSTSINETKNEIIINIEKLDKINWPILTTDNNLPYKKDLDPQSSYNLFTYNLSEHQEAKTELLINAKNKGYIPAIQRYIELNESILHPFELVTLLEKASYYYGSVEMIEKLASIQLEFNNNVDCALGLYNYAMSKGSAEAAFQVGEILSPLSSVKYTKKDPGAAFSAYKQAYKFSPHPRAMYGAALLLNYGLGVEKNEEEALILWTTAHRLDSTIPNPPVTHSEGHFNDDVIEEEEEEEAAVQPQQTPTRKKESTSTSESSESEEIHAPEQKENLEEKPQTPKEQKETPKQEKKVETPKPEKQPETPTQNHGETVGKPSPLALCALSTLRTFANFVRMRDSPGSPYRRSRHHHRRHHHHNDSSSDYSDYSYSDYDDNTPRRHSRSNVSRSSNRSQNRNHSRSRTSPRRTPHNH